jgi:hypothetical protein
VCILSRVAITVERLNLNCAGNVEEQSMPSNSLTLRSTIQKLASRIGATVTRAARSCDGQPLPLIFHDAPILKDFIRCPVCGPARGCLLPLVDLADQLQYLITFSSRSDFLDILRTGNLTHLNFASCCLPSPALSDLTHRPVL